MNNLIETLHDNQAIFVALLTVLGSGTASALVSQRYTGKRAELDFKRKKLEELFVAVEDFFPSIEDVCFNFVRLVLHVLPPDEQTAHVKELDRIARILSNVTMLSNLYFPRIRNELEVLVEIESEVKNIFTGYADIMDTDEPNDDLAYKFFDEMKVIRETQKRINVLITSEARHLHKTYL